MQIDPLGDPPVSRFKTHLRLASSSVGRSDLSVVDGHSPLEVSFSAHATPPKSGYPGHANPEHDPRLLF